MATNSTKLDDTIVYLPSDTTANRPGLAGGTQAGVTAVAGMMRFNETTSYMEYYDGTQWNAITSPPAYSSCSPTFFSSAGDVITVTGSNFQSGATVSLISKTGTLLNAATTTFISASSLSFVITSAMAADVNDPFDIKVINPSGLSAIGAAALSLTVNPTFTTASGTLGTIYDSTRSSYSLTAVVSIKKFQAATT